jgi:hypothetical protein
MNILYDLNKHSNYGIDSVKECDDNNIVQHIAKDYHNMTDFELNQLVVKTMTNKEIRSRLLLHELRFYEQTPKYMCSLDKFKQEVQKLLIRYSHKAGGFKIDDREWTCHDHASKQYKIYVNELVFENTISKDYISDAECCEFLRLLIKRLNMIAINIRVTFHTHYVPRDQIYYLLLKCKNTFSKKKTH